MLIRARCQSKELPRRVYRFLLFLWHRAHTCVSPGGAHRNFGECQQTANCSTQYTILYSWVYRNFKLV